MPAIVDFPTVVQNALNEFGPLFANEPERKHFAEYLKGKELKAEELAAQIDPKDRKLIRMGDSRQCYFTKSSRIPGVDHKVRLVVLWDKRHDKKAKKCLITNRTAWEVTRVLRAYRYRWTGTECFHRDGKQHCVAYGTSRYSRGQPERRHGRVADHEG